MAATFDRNTLESAFHDLGRRAWALGRTVEVVVYGGSALVLCFDWRQSTRDIDAVFEADRDVVRPLVAEIARERDWPTDWLNDGVKGYLSPADRIARHFFGAFPSDDEPGLRVLTAAPAYLFAMKCRAMRVAGVEGAGDIEDIRALGRELGHDRRRGAGSSGDVLSRRRDRAEDAVRPGRDLRAWRDARGEAMRPDSIFEISRLVAEEAAAFDIAWREFLDSFYLDPAGRAAALSRPPLPLDPLRDAYLGATAEHLASVYRLPVPAWCGEHGMALRAPHFAGGLESLKATLLRESPAAFRRRLLFVSKNALSRATERLAEAGGAS